MVNVGWRELAPLTFHIVRGKILSYGLKTVCQILTDSFLPAIFCQTSTPPIPKKHREPCVR
jgi:hypothetical protein